MKKILFSLFILLAVNTQAQFIYPTESAWMFLSGIYGGNYGNLHISADGDIDTIKGNAYDFPDSLRVASAGSRYYLTGVLSGGQYDLDWRRPTKADISALTSTQVLYGASDGSIAQSSTLSFDATVPALTIDGANSGINVTGSATSEIRLNNTSTTDYIIINNASGDLLIENPNANVGSPFIYTRASERIGLRQTAPLQDFHLLADTIRFEGLDGTGTYLGIDVNGDVTRTTVTGFGDVYKVGTPVNNQVGIWTGDGTIEGDVDLTFDGTTFGLTGNQIITNAVAGTTPFRVIGHASQSNALMGVENSGGDVLFQVGVTGKTVVARTAADGVAAVRFANLNAGATGDLLELTNSTGNVLTVDIEGKISEYGNSVPSNGQILIGDGTDMELATITAGSGITVSNGAGSITIAETNEAATTYTPTAASVTNVASIGTVYADYYRDGDMVYVFVYTTAAATGASALTEMSVTLPIASNFANTYNCKGSGTALSSANANGFPGRVFGSVASDVAIFAWRPTSTATLEINFSFSYKIL